MWGGWAQPSFSPYQCRCKSRRPTTTTTPLEYLEATDEVPTKLPPAPLEISRPLQHSLARWSLWCTPQNGEG